MKLFISVKLLLVLTFVFPCTVYAHLLEIKATTPFPETVAATTITTAIFTVTNISKHRLTAVNISDFPKDSGLSLLSTSCNIPLQPGQTCTIELSLNARSVGKEISTALKIWAKPSADIVRYPIRVSVAQGLPKISLKEVHPPHHKPKLPRLREPMVAELEGKWLILSGSLGNFHDFENDFNTDLYVYNPKTSDIKSVLISDTDLPDDVKNQLASTAPEFLQEDETLYIVGGYFEDDSVTPSNYTTLNTVTIIDIAGLMKAVEKGKTDLKQFIAYCSDNTTACPPNFKVTGGQLGKLGRYLYLSYGQDCEGFYCGTSQEYTYSIYKFTAYPNYAHNTLTINNIDEAYNDEPDSGWRKRDYTLTSFKWQGKDALLALAGPFTPGDSAQVWTNGIIFNEDLEYNSNFISQQGNQYAVPHLAMYSDKHKTSYVATFGGLSNLYWSTTGLEYDNTTPYGNILDLIIANTEGEVREYIELDPLCSGKPLNNCLYMGLAAIFIPIEQYYDHRDVLKLDSLPKNTKTLVGYLYGGLISFSQEPFSDPNTVTNKIYEVYIDPSVEGRANWQDVTNMFTQPPTSSAP